MLHSRRPSIETLHYFATIDRVLERGGIACVQTILIPDDRWERYRKAPDWIEQYVFPGCLIRSLTALTVAATASSRLTMLDVHEIGPHYAETLQRWCANVHEHIDEIRARGYDRAFEPASSIDAIGMVAKKENSSSVVILSVVDQSSGSYASTGCEK